jgi:hypothetical protein
MTDFTNEMDKRPGVCAGEQWWTDGFRPIGPKRRTRVVAHADLERFSELIQEKIVSVAASKDGAFLIATETDIYLAGKTVLDNWVLKPLKFVWDE